MEAWANLMSAEAAAAPALEREVGGSRRAWSGPAPRLCYRCVLDTIDLGFRAQRLLLALLLRCGLAESNAREPMRLGAVLTGSEGDDRVERRGVHARR